MAKIEIYTTEYCPYCTRAKVLLKRKGATYTEIRVDQDEERKKEMLHRAHGQRTVPQIFINDRHIGGSDDLYELEQTGKLDPLLR